LSAESGQTLSHYRLVEKIGEGGMGVVWKAEDTALNRTVAIKVLPADQTFDEERRRMFLDEARLAASVSHGNIVQVHELGRDGDLDFIVMEYVEGQPLTNLLRRRPLPPDKVADWGGQVAQGVARAHRKGLMHRDLKPANILITDDGEAKVVDFGLATLFSRTDESAVSLATTMTEIAEEKQHGIVGTLPYMSPEQVRGEKLDARSDIFSLGSVLYEMTTGERPFVGREPAQVAQAILECQPQPIHERVPDVPLNLHRVIEKSLRRKPADRYQGLDDVAVDLKHVSRELESGSSPSFQDLHNVAVPPSRRWIPAVVSGLAVALLALAGWWALNRAPSPPTLETSAVNENSLAVFSFENLKDPADPDRLGQILQELVITDLSGLDPLRVLSSQRLFDVQKQIGGKGDRLAKALNTEVAVKAGAGKMLTGTLSQLGEKWIVAAQMVDVATGEVVQSNRIDGTDLYTMVDKLTTELQEGLRITPPTELVSVRELTSSSLDAYRLYLEGVDLLNNAQYYEARDKLQAAIGIDPNFGQAYYKLAVALRWKSDTREAAKAIFDEFLARELHTSDKEKRMAEAARAVLDNQFAETLPVLRQLVKDYPDEKDLWFELGETLYHSPGGGKHEEALEAFEKAIELDPDFLLASRHIFEILHARLNNLYDRRDFRGALAESRRLVREYPEHHDWKKKRLYYAVRVGDEAEAANALDEALETASTVEERMWTHDHAARAYRDAGEHNRALEFFRQAMALATTPDSRTIMSERIGWLERLRGRTHKAQRWFQACIDADSTHKGGLWGIFNVSRDRGDRDATLAAMEARFAVESPGYFKDTRPALRALLSGRIDEARREYEQLLARPAADSRVWGRRRDVAWQFIDANHPEDVAAICRPAFELPKSQELPDIHYVLATSHFLLGRFDDAERVFQDALTVEHPDTVGILSELAFCQLSQGQPDSAEASIRRALEVGQASWGYLALGLAHAARGRYEEARSVAEQCVARDSTRASHELLAWVLVAGDLDVDQGAREARRALELMHRTSSTSMRLSVWPPADHSLGLAYLKKKDARSAVDHLLRAAEVSPKRESVQRDLARAKALLGTP
jgi:serine/threonine protein kinase/tetratricopeptide (TPR) repeat protein